MCLTPKYLINPLIKKSELECEIDYKKLSLDSDFRFSFLSRLPGGKVKVSELSNKVTYLNHCNLPYGRCIPLYIKVPCGKCFECIKQRVNQLVSRMQLELNKHSNFGFFITLTYSDENLPLIRSPNSDVLLPSVNKKDIQDFLKRLRINLVRAGYDVSNFKYFYISEYGFSNTNNKRPHYHLSVFFDLMAVNEFYDVVAKSWKLGNFTLDILNENRMRYCAMSHCTASKLFPNDDGTSKPFSHWSKGFGVPNSSDLKFIRSHNSVCVGSFNYSLDRYLKQKSFSKHELLLKTASSASVASQDDDLKRFKIMARKLFPNKKLGDLTFSEVKKVDFSISSSLDTEKRNFYKRYVLKRKN